MTIENHQTFGDRLKTTRKKRLMTQQQLSGASGIAQSLISALERGERSGQSIEAATLFKLSAALEISPILMMTGDGDMNYNGSEDLERLMRKIERLTLGQIRAIDIAVDAMIPSNK